MEVRGSFKILAYISYLLNFSCTWRLQGDAVGLNSRILPGRHLPVLVQGICIYSTTSDGHYCWYPNQYFLWYPPCVLLGLVPLPRTSRPVIDREQYWFPFSVPLPLHTLIQRVPFPNVSHILSLFLPVYIDCIKFARKMASTASSVRPGLRQTLKYSRSSAIMVRI